MSYKASCDNCSGNGYIKITNTEGETEAKQCCTCESKGELTYDEKDITKISDGLSATDRLKRMQ